MSAGEELPEGLAESHRAWTEAVNGTDLSSYADLVCEDVAWLPPGEESVEGRDAFEAWLAPFFEAYRYDFSIDARDFRVAGRRALERGRFRSRMTPRSGGEPGEHEGRFVALWRRDADGTWRIDRYVDVTDAGAPGG